SCDKQALLASARPPTSRLLNRSGNGRSKSRQYGTEDWTRQDSGLSSQAEIIRPATSRGSSGAALKVEGPVQLSHTSRTVELSCLSDCLCDCLCLPSCNLRASSARMATVTGVN